MKLKDITEKDQLGVKWRQEVERIDKKGNPYTEAFFICHQITKEEAAEILEKYPDRIVFKRDRMPNGSYKLENIEK